MAPPPADSNQNEAEGRAQASPPTGPLSPDLLYRRCDPTTLGFETTADIEPLDGVIGQPRAVAAVEFGIDIRRPGYNIFALGPPGTGKHSMILDFLHGAAANRDVPDDWCYVQNFDEPHKPRALRLPNGRATVLRDDMVQLVDELRAAIPAAFDSDDYRSRRELIESDYKHRNQQAFGSLQEEAKANGIAIVPTQQGIGFAPMEEGEVIKPEVFNELSEEKREAYRKKVEGYQERLEVIMRQAGAWEREARQRLRELNRDVTSRAAADLVFTLQDKYHDLPHVHAYLEDVRDDVVKSAFDFLRASADQMTPGQGAAQASGQNVQNLVSGSNELVGGDEPASFRRYHVNVIVHNRAGKGAPVVLEDPPGLTNLLGRVEHGQKFGALVTDFTFIKPGALHRANGGYLVVDARKVLMQPFAYEALKRMLTTGEIRIESGQQLAGASQISTLEPEPIPLDIKVVMVGDAMLYYLLAAQDPDFTQLFKVQAEFEDRMALTSENIDLYARLIATLAQSENLCPLEAGAVA
ncbi:MAG: ATP-binding protein, partial [Pseudomonadota bacterium]